MQIENEYANELLIASRKGDRIQDFMNAISGVEGYRLDNPNRQGCIRGMFSKELISEQFLLEFDDIVSVFWQGVFEKIDKAKLWREKVEIKSPGKKKEFRQTDKNPIHFLRAHGAFAVRNYITSLYRKNLQQSCGICGFTTSIKNDKLCKKKRNGKKCNNIMSTTYKFVDIKNDTNDLYEDQLYRTVENNNMESAIQSILREFAEKVLGSGTRAYQVFKIITEPNASIVMCKVCNLCPAKTFDIESCTNYNVNIGNFLGVNRTMIANKVRSIRKRLPEFLFSIGTEEAKYILDIIPKKHKVFLSIID